MLNKNLISLLGNDKKKLGFITILNIVSLLANVTITAMICLALYEAYCENYSFVTYLPYIFIVILCVIARFMIVGKVSKLKTELGSKVKYNFRKKIVYQIYKLGLAGGKDSTTTMTQLVVEGIEQLNLYFTVFLPQFLYGMIAPVVLFIICLFIEWRTSLVLIICLPFIPISIMLVSRFAKKIFAKYWDKYISMGDGFLDSVNGMKELKIFDADKRKQIEIAEKSEEFRKITMKVLVMQLSSLTIIDLVAFGGAGVAIVVTLLNAGTTPEAVFQSLFLILICAEFFLPMRGLGSAFHIAMNGTTAGTTLMELLRQDCNVGGTISISQISNITLDHITFGYEEHKNILENVSMKFEKGIHSIVGESGSGKSTITSLLIGSHIPQSGDIIIDNIYFESYSLSSYYNHLAIIGMNTHIFNMSIRDNFKLVKPDVTDQEIWSALDKVNMYDFVKDVGGLDYLILEDAQNISGGQKQRLAFAIHTISPKSLYVFDEPTSNIDIESERIIMKNITALAEDSIVILISHRLQNVVSSRRIFMLKDKRICEEGTHNELMKLEGEYCQLYTTQQALENGYKEVSYA